MKTLLSCFQLLMTSFSRKNFKENTLRIKFAKSQWFWFRRNYFALYHYVHITKEKSSCLGPQVTDLRVQLHKKRRLQKPRIEVHDDDISEDEDDKDSLENAHISDVDEDDDPVPMVRQRKIQVSNRIVQKTGSPRKVNIEPEKSKIR